MPRVLLQPPLPFAPTWEPRYKRLPFSPPMVVATRKGAKTETRRLVGPAADRYRSVARIEGSVNGWRFSVPADDSLPLTLDLGSPLAVGDRCYVAEDWAISLRGCAIACEDCAGTGHVASITPPKGQRWSERRTMVRCGACQGKGGFDGNFERIVRYAADGEETVLGGDLWPLFNHIETKPGKNPDPWRVRRGRFMYRAFARTFLEIVGVDVEALGDVDGAAVFREGYPTGCGRAPLDWFAELWMKINGSGAWDDLNRWVFVYRFRVVKEGE